MNLDLFQPISETQKQRVNAAMLEKPPHEPGVYTMYGKKDEVLYVGKAKDLFKRIASYRYSKSRKVQSLIAHVHRIGFEICKTEMDAILLENLLIRSLRPPYNHANKKPETYYFISVKRRGNEHEFRLSMRVLEDYQETFGCFKGHGRVRKGLGALLKLQYLKTEHIKSVYFLPAQLLSRLVPMRFHSSLTEEDLQLACELLSGESDQLIQNFEQLVSERIFADRFTGNYFNNELEQLKIFYALGPERNQQIRKEMDLESSVILQHQLDDLQVMNQAQIS